MKSKLISAVEKAQVAKASELTAKQAEVQKSNVTRTINAFNIGDTVDVHHWIETGEKGRLQVFSGTVIGRKGEGICESFVVRRIVQGEGVERTFPLNSPKIAKIEVKRSGKVRRAKLYYLRDRVGKATRVKELKVKTTKPVA
ncbi:50S ribosomal protein L19 [Telmatocola sphagniphila]|jgi:large subunit ribosomal protein L19|uniref:Large ribosomal subunit protein bL19 n=1 Tax=Telmatocola sphagniphila TaxID=1123043 RepID=A0A8E6B7T3_9BACT|nr:50S ribosomal protein L19 [Telmatocola sphagniphila]QVL32844.1 50S ribosomal protein L19 [Telmatocola sphagniphila]